MTTKPYEFPQSLVQSTGGGTDFPGSAGDRERGKFRPSTMPRHTQVAVTGDDGRPVTQGTDQLLAEMVLWQKATVLASVWLADGMSFTVDELLAEASKL